MESSQTYRGRHFLPFNCVCSLISHANTHAHTHTHAYIHTHTHRHPSVWPRDQASTHKQMSKVTSSQRNRIEDISGTHLRTTIQHTRTHTQPHTQNDKHNPTATIQQHHLSFSISLPWDESGVTSQNMAASGY